MLSASKMKDMDKSLYNRCDSVEKFTNIPQLETVHILDLVRQLLGSDSPVCIPVSLGTICESLSLLYL